MDENVGRKAKAGSAAMSPAVPGQAGTCATTAHAFRYFMNIAK